MCLSECALLQSYRQQQLHSLCLREIMREGAGMCIWQHFVSWPFHCFFCIWGSQSFACGGPFNPGNSRSGLHNRFPLQGNTIQEKLGMVVNKKSPSRLPAKVARNIIWGSWPTTATGGSKFHFDVQENVAVICQNINGFAYGLGPGTESKLTLPILFYSHRFWDDIYNKNILLEMHIINIRFSGTWSQHSS